MTGQKETMDDDYAAFACRMNYLSAQKLLVIKAPHSVHYEISQLLKSIREAASQPEPIPVPESIPTY